MNIKNLKTTTCECGHILGKGEIKPPVLAIKAVFGEDIKSFFGGRVNSFCKGTCICGKVYMLYLEDARGSYDVIDMHFLNDPVKVNEPSTENKNTENPSIGLKTTLAFIEKKEYDKLEEYLLLKTTHNMTVKSIGLSLEIDLTGLTKKIEYISAIIGGLKNKDIQDGGEN